ncbi:MAG: AAA family ATPase, partial [Flavobacterium sp.]
SLFVNDVIESGTIELTSLIQKKPFLVRINSNETAVAIPKTEIATEMGITKEMMREYVINGVIKDWKTYTTTIGEYLKSKYHISVQNTDNTKNNYVLIIDEINRGNVSQIFGELITLIEEDKRLGKEEALEVTLPYSKGKFGVPLNLYIIGTMNTADRSVEALDTALRRRFSFEEMMPLTELLSPSALYCQLLWNYETVGWDDPEFKEKEDQFFDFAQVSEDFKNKRKEIWEIMKADYIKDDFSYFEEFDYNGFNLQAILEKINNRIEILLNRDHLIGHSYFLKVNTEEQLKASFKNNIIPLLQEYFYGDYEKIGMIIGSGFFDETEKYVNEDFASFKTQNYPEDGSLLRFKTIDEDFDIVDAIKKLLNIKEEKKTDA